jgi:hypothetical protein
MTGDVNETSYRLNRVATDLQNIGYRAEIKGPSIISSMTGYLVDVVIYPNKTIQFSSGFSISKLSIFDVGRANAYNRKYRFSKVYLDDDGDAVLSTDFFYDWDVDERESVLRRLVVLHEASLGFLANEFEKSTDDEARQPQTP